MKNAKQTKQDFCIWVDDCRNKYLDIVEESNGNATQNEVDEKIKDFKDYFFRDVSVLKSLDINDLLFVASFNSELKNNPDIEEYVTTRILSQNEEENLHMLSAFLANTDTIFNMEYDSINVVVNHLCDKVESEPGYCFELPFLKEIQTKYNDFVEECFSLIEEYGFVGISCEAKMIQKKLKAAISSSTLKKADYLGWKIVK